MKYVWQHGWGKCNVPTGTENLYGESLYKKVFRANLGKSGQNILCTPKKLPATTPMLRKFHCLTTLSKPCFESGWFRSQSKFFASHVSEFSWKSVFQLLSEKLRHFQKSNLILAKSFLKCCLWFLKNELKSRHSTKTYKTEQVWNKNEKNWSHNDTFQRLTLV